MSKCKLCNKSYSFNKYKSFGRGCLNKMYKITDIKIPKDVKDKESYLISKIARRLKQKNLSKEQKIELSELYLANCYIDKIDYIDMGNVKEKLEKILETANMVMPNKDLTMMLYAMYKLYKATDTFKNGLREIETMEITEHKNKEELEEIKKDRTIINGFKYIFDTSKITNPAIYTLNYYRQYAFWKTVVTGGLFLNYKLASQLLEHSLSVFGEQPEDFTIYDSSIIQKILDDEDFNNEFKRIVSENKNEAYLEKTGGFTLETNTDLKYSLQNVSYKAIGEKNDNGKWNIKVELTDRFDFTNCITINEAKSGLEDIAKNIELSAEQKSKSILKNSIGYILNNLAMMSVQYGVIKEFDVKVSIELKDFE